MKATRRTVRIAIGLAISGMLAAVTAACGSAGSATLSGAASIDFNYGVSGVVNPSTHKGGTLELGAISEPSTFDPGNDYDAWLWNIERIYGRTILTYDTKPSPGAASKIVPDMAADLGKVSPDGLTWTFHLKAGLKYSTGAPITTADIKYAVERSYDQSGVLGGGPPYFQKILIDPTYPGPYEDPDPQHLGLTAIETPDPTTIIFHLQAPFADFPFLMTLPETTPVPPATDLKDNTGHADGTDPYGSDVVASGPYEFQSHTPDVQVTWVRNPYWSPSTDSVRPALPDKIHLTFYGAARANQMESDIQAGKIAVSADGQGASNASVSQILGNANLKKLSDNPISTGLRYVSIEPSVPPFDNIHCRLAVAYALNKVTLVDALGGQVAGGAIATTMLAPGVAGHKDADLLPDGADHQGDLNAAKAQLAQCGQPNGFSTVIATMTDPKAEQFGAALKDALSRVGINADVHAVPRSSKSTGVAYFGNYISNPATVKEQKLGLLYADWSPDWPSGYGFFPAIVDGREIKTQGNFNFASLNDPEVNKLIDDSTKATSSKDAADIFSQIDQAVMKDAVYVPYGFDRPLLLRSPNVTNAYVTEAYGAEYDLASLGVQG